MDHNPDRLCIYPGYFDAKLSRRKGRRVPKDASVIKPDLEKLVNAAKSLGVRKMKREDGVSHPKRPHMKEGRLWISAQGAKESVGAGSKEELLQLIGGEWKSIQNSEKQAERKALEERAKPGNAWAKNQRKSRGGAARNQRGRKSWKK